ncbi:DNA glycosylase [Phlebopus sp. FC_14]|nr:DNA glycosylase [Phlebopus sp. FC_14]
MWDDPWKLVIAVRLLNVTTARVAIPVFCKIVSRWPTPQDIVDAPLNELVDLLRPLGLYNKRAKWLKDISQLYMDDPPRYPSPNPDVLSPEAPMPMSQGSSQSNFKTRNRNPSYPDTPISHFPGVGPYALDSFRIFCKSTLEEGTRNDEWKNVMPADKELIQYLRWKWACEERKIWYSNGVGVVGEVDVPYLVTLVDELAERYDAMVGGEGYMYHFSADLSDILTS